MAEGMTDNQFNAFLEMIVEIIKTSDSKEDAVKRVEALVK